MGGQGGLLQGEGIFEQMMEYETNLPYEDRRILPARKIVPRPCGGNELGMVKEQREG